MATTSISLDITSDITPNLSISANVENLTKTGTTTGLELVDMGHGQLTQASNSGNPSALAEALGTADTANYVYLCNTSTDVEQYIKVGIHDMLLGNLGSGEFMFIPWNMGDSDAEINIEAEDSGTIDYDFAIFKSTFTLPAKT